jgi:hypothetical protein
MQHKGFDPVPVYHYGDDLARLEGYIAGGAKNIALGNTVGIKDKAVVARWCADIHSKFPHITLHLLGSSSIKIVQSMSVDSCDSSAWYMMAVNGKPIEISGKTREAKTCRAEANMRKIMEVFNETAISLDNCNSERFNGQV